MGRVAVVTGRSGGIGSATARRTESVAKAVAFLAAETTFTTGQAFLLDGDITGVRIVR